MVTFLQSSNDTKKDVFAGVFIWTLRIFLERLFSKTPNGDYFQGEWSKLEFLVYTNFSLFSIFLSLL